MEQKPDAYMREAIRIVQELDQARASGKPVPEHQIIADGIKRFVEQRSSGLPVWGKPFVA